MAFRRRGKLPHPLVYPPQRAHHAPAGQEQAVLCGEGAAEIRCLLRSLQTCVAHLLGSVGFQSMGAARAPARTSLALQREDKHDAVPLLRHPPTTEIAHRATLGYRMFRLLVNNILSRVTMPTPGYSRRHIRTMWHSPPGPDQPTGAPPATAWAEPPAGGRPRSPRRVRSWPRCCPQPASRPRQAPER